MSFDPKDQENLMTIAREVAKATVEEMGLKLRERDDALRDSIVKDVRKELESYFGDQSPAEHMIQHARMDKFLAWLDGMGKNFWSGLLSNLLRAVVTGAAAVFVYSRVKG
jgi:hypothetical protein